MDKVLINESDVRKMVSEAVNAVAETDELLGMVKRVMADIDKYLQGFGLRAKLLKSTYSEWVGQYQYRSAKTGVLKFSVSLDAIRRFAEESAEVYGMADESGFSFDKDEEARIQVMITLWHECGHGLIQHIKYCRKKSNLAKDGVFKGALLKDTRELLHWNEEEVVEEFGEYMAGEYYDSDLFNYLEKYKSVLQYKA